MKDKRLSKGLRAILTITLFVTSTYAATEKVLYSFNSVGTNGYYPDASLIFDTAGNLYGVTSNGGTQGLGTLRERENSREFSRVARDHPALSARRETSCDPACPLTPLIRKERE